MSECRSPSLDRCQGTASLISPCPELWRAARALAGLTQRQLSILSEVSRRNIATSEAGETISFDNVERLRRFYGSYSINFLGTADFQSGHVSGPGVTFVGSPGDIRSVGREERVISAARAILGCGLAQVARGSGLSVSVISRMEREDAYRNSHYTLLRYYERIGIEFLYFLPPSSSSRCLVGLRLWDSK